MGRRNVNAIVTALALIVSPIVNAEERMYQPPVPEMVGYPNWVLTPNGKTRLDATLERQVAELVTLRAENSSLKESLVKMESKPALTWQAVALLVGLGLVGGVTVGVMVAR
jgi:hypothetical protein